MSNHTSPSTPELRAYLTGGRMTRLQGQKLAQRVRKWFAPDAQQTHRMPEEDLEMRILLMWRLVRGMAGATGLCAPEELLEDATEFSPNPWLSGFKPRLGPADQSLLRKGTATTLLNNWQAGGLPLLPPKDGPDEIKRWCVAAGCVARDVGMDRNSDGLVVLAPLLNPATAAWCDVSAGMVMDLEDLLVSSALDALLEFGERPAIKHFRDEYSLSRKEAEGLLRLAKAQALRRRGTTTMEEDRALQAARLEEMIGRARAEMNTGEELKAIRELSRVLGLTRTQPDDLGADFAKVIGQVAAEQDAAGVLDKRSIQLLESLESAAPQPPVEDDPHDAESVLEYDIENRR